MAFCEAVIEREIFSWMSSQAHLGPAYSIAIEYVLENWCSCLSVHRFISKLESNYISTNGYYIGIPMSTNSMALAARGARFRHGVTKNLSARPILAGSPTHKRREVEMASGMINHLLHSQEHIGGSKNPTSFVPITAQ
jgi:hypothetical protein